MAQLPDIYAFIPVGGAAKRLQPLTLEVSKALVRFLGRPLIEYTIIHLARQGVRNFIFGVKGYVNYRSLFDYFQEGYGISSKYGLDPRISIKYQPNIDDVGSADSFLINLEYYGLDNPVIVAQGDIIFNIDLEDLLQFHEENSAFTTIAVTRVSDPSAYGVVEVDGKGRVSGFVEKPRREEAPSNLASTGIYLFSRDAKRICPDPDLRARKATLRRLDFGMDLIPYLIQKGFRVYAYEIKGDWYDVGTPELYLQSMNRIMNSGLMNGFFAEPIYESGGSRLWILGQSQAALRRKEEILRKVKEGKIRIEGNVLIGRHCQIGDDVIISDSCVDNYCYIGDSVTIERSAIHDRVYVGEGAYIQDSIVARHAKILSTRTEPTVIMGLSIIGDNALVEKGSMLTNARIAPHTYIAHEAAIAKRELV
ncbi:MAG: NDP-sugar synthase [Nitrososphaerota archaeon]